MDYNLTLFKDSVRDILLMQNASLNSNQDPNSSKNQTIDANLSQAMGASFNNGESGDSGFILGGDMK